MTFNLVIHLLKMQTYLGPRGSLRSHSAATEALLAFGSHTACVK